MLISFFGIYYHLQLLHFSFEKIKFHIFYEKSTRFKGMFNFKTILLVVVYFPTPPPQLRNACHLPTVTQALQINYCLEITMLCKILDQLMHHISSRTTFVLLRSPVQSNNGSIVSQLIPFSPANSFNHFMGALSTFKKQNTTLS